MFGIDPVLIDEINLLKTINPNEIKPILDPKSAAINGATLLRNKIATARNVPSIEPKAFQSDFRYPFTIAREVLYI